MYALHRERTTLNFVRRLRRYFCQGKKDEVTKLAGESPISGPSDSQLIELYSRPYDKLTLIGSLLYVNVVFMSASGIFLLKKLDDEKLKPIKPFVMFTSLLCVAFPFLGFPFWNVFCRKYAVSILLDQPNKVIRVQTMSILPWKLNSEKINLTRIVPTPTGIAHLKSKTNIVHLTVRTHAGPTVPLPNQVKTFPLEVQKEGVHGNVKHNYFWKLLAGEL